MRPLDSHFNDRVRETSLGLGALMFLALLGSENPYLPLSFGLGLALSLLMWRGAQLLGEALTRPPRGVLDWAKLAVVYVGRYIVAGGLLWALTRSGGFEALAFTGGFALVGLVVALKAVAWLVLPAQLDPAPIYSQDRKAGPR